MSYRNPAVLQDTNAFNAKAKSLQNITKGSDETFKPAEEEKLSDVSKNLDPDSGSINKFPFKKWHQNSGYQQLPDGDFYKNGFKIKQLPDGDFYKNDLQKGLPNSEPSMTAPSSTTALDWAKSAFYKGNNPINDSSFYNQQNQIPFDEAAHQKTIDDANNEAIHITR